MVAAAVLSIAAAACTTAPVQEMSNARQAVQAAAQAGAPRYAPGLYAKAQRWLDDAEFALKSGDYDRARSSAAKAAAAAHSAASAAHAARPPVPATGPGPAAPSRTILTSVVMIEVSSVIS